ncbi:MAG TPA: hypothetical protein VGL78_04560, partial [Solirubrobacteraceae bacterium]
RGVAKLRGRVHHASALVQQQARIAVPQVIGTGMIDAGSPERASERTPAPRRRDGLDDAPRQLAEEAIMVARATSVAHELPIAQK